MSGRVHSIESCGTVDGPGIRMVVFLSGCPMRCLYCHNPDTWDPKGGTLTSVEELLAQYDKMKHFYTKGGITVSGGEPLMQIRFVTELFTEAKKRGIHTCLDTSGATFRPEDAAALAQFDALCAVTDLVLLDIMLPVMDGWSVLKKIRENDKTPVIMLTAKGETQDKVAGLEGGADDYIVKPFEMKEVLARIHAVLRRFGGEEEGSGEKKLTFDKLVINLDSYELLVDGKRVDTPPKELELLYHLAASPNRVFTRNQLLDEVWGFDYFGDSRTVDVHIKRLREKLEGVSEQWSLKTVWGVGYKFEVVNG